MRRAALERSRTLRIWREHHRIVHNDLPTLCGCDQQPGRFRKGRRIAGCSRLRCGICKRHKLYQNPSAREYREAITYRDWARELGFAVRMPRYPA